MSVPIRYKDTLIMPGSEAWRLWHAKQDSFVFHIQQVHNAAVKRVEIKEVPTCGQY